MTKFFFMSALTEACDSVFCLNFMNDINIFSNLLIIKNRNFPITQKKHYLLELCCNTLGTETKLP